MTQTCLSYGNAVATFAERRLLHIALFFFSLLLLLLLLHVVPANLTNGVMAFPTSPLPHSLFVDAKNACVRSRGDL
jgi:hypothetical protein